MKILLFFTGFFVVAILLASCGSGSGNGSGNGSGSGNGNSAPVPKLSVESSTGNETDGVTFTLTLNRKAARDIYFEYHIEAGTAEQVDFASTVRLDTEMYGTIVAENSTLDIVIDIEYDGAIEADETFSLILRDIYGATFDPAGDTLTVIGTIINDADADGNGLIEIGNAEEMNNIRYNLAGTSYKTSETDTGDANNCPDVGCNGYELINNIDLALFAKFANWTPIQGGYSTSITTSGDCSDNSGIWVGAKCLLPEAFFSAIFDGKDNSISNLNVSRSSNLLGLFGVVSGTIRDLSLVGGSITGQGYIGAVAGYLVSDGIVENVSSDLAVIGIGSVIGYMGGLVGSNGGTIRNSNTTDAVTSSGGGAGPYRVGGFVGLNSGTIQDSYATGAVNGGANSDSVGGFVGLNSGTIEDSNATGVVNGGANSDIVGGLVGTNADGGTIQGSNATGAVTGGGGAGPYRVGGLVGLNSGTIQDSYATGAVNGGAGIDRVGGLVGTNDDGGTIEDSNATGAVNGGAGDDWVGGLVGANYLSTVQNSYSTTGVDGAGIPVGGAGSDWVGGLVGYSTGSFIQGSYATGAVNGSANSDSVGGLLGGLNGGVVRNSYANVVVSVGGSERSVAGGLVGYVMTNSVVRNSYAIGKVNGGTGDDWVGGLVGQNYGRLQNSYVLTNVYGRAGTDDVGRVAGFNANTGTLFGNYYSTAFTLDGEVKRTIGANEVKGKDAGGLKALTATITENNFAGDSNGWSTKNWNFRAGKYPSLKSYKVENDAQVKGVLLCGQGNDWVQC